MELLKRQRRILQILINNQDTYLSSDNIADLLGVSYKTVQTDIDVLRDQIDAYDVEIESVRGKGYQLRFYGNDDLQILNILTQVRRQERQNVDVSLFTCKILSNPLYTTQQDIMDLLWVSTGQLKEILSEVVMALAHHNLKIKSVPGSGFIITGPEFGKRLAFIYHLNVIESNPKMYDRFLENIEVKNISVDYHATNAITKLLEREGYHINEVSQSYLAYYINYMNQRVRDKMVVMQVEHFIPYFEGMKFEDDAIIREVCRDSFIEIKYMRVFLMFLVNESEIRNKIEHTIRERQLYDEVDRFFNRRKALFRNSFFDVNTLQKAISQAIVMMMRRNSIGYREFQLNLNEIDRSDEMVVAIEFASLLLFKIENDMKVEFYQEDIMRLAMIFNVHFYKDLWSKFKRFIIYSDYSMTQVMFLKRKLELVFPFVEVIEANHLNMNDLVIHEASDLLIYERDNDKRGYPYEIVFESLTMANEIVHYLQSYVSDVNQKKQIFVDLFSKDRFHQKQNFKRRNDVVSWICDLYDTGEERKSVIQANVYTREMRYLSTVYNRAAYPKIYVDNIDRPLMEVVTLEKPMLWGGKEVDVIFIAMLPNSYTSLNVLGQPFNRIRRNANLIQRIKSSESFEEMMRYMDKEIEKAY